MKSLTIADGIFLFIAGAGLASGIWFFFNDPAFSARAGSGKPVGSVTYRFRDAERRHTGSSLWAAIGDGQTVYNGDTIRTGALSKAAISLDGNAEIVLDSQSMVVIRVTEARTVVSVQDGTAVVSAAVPVTLAAGNDNVTLDSGSIQIRKDGENANLRAETPGAVISTAEGKTYKMGETSRFDLNTGTAAEASAWVSEPKDGTQVFARGAAALVQFSWSDPRRRIRLEAPGSEPVTLASGAAAGQAAEARAELRPGTWTWNLEDTEESGRLTVFPDPMPTQLTPAGTAIEGSGSAIPITFRWSAPAGSSRFRFELYKADSRAAALASKTVVTRSTALSVPGPGSYRWTVTALSADRTSLSAPAEAAFAVVDTPPAPPLLDPSASVVVRETLSGGAALTRWKADPQAIEYEVRLSDDAKGETNAQFIFAPQNYYAPSVVPEAGTRFISVRSRRSAGYSAWSEPKEVTVVSAAPPIPAAGQPGAALPVEKGRVTLVWSDSAPMPRYRVELSASPDFSKPLAVAEVRSSPAVVPVPKDFSGDLWWRIESLDSTGKTVASSEPVRAAIPLRLQAPETVRPADGTVFELNKTNQIQFAWRCAEENARFRLSVYRVLGGLNVPVGSWETAQKEFTLTNLSILALDTFAWSVEALPRSGSDAEGGAESGAAISETSVFTIRQKDTLAVPRIRRMETRGAL